MLRILGIDEAGRGCVIGPLVLAGVLIERRSNVALRRMGVADSKRLTRAQRERQIQQIERAALCSYILPISPAALSRNINVIELESMAAMIDMLQPDKVYVDAPVHPRGLPEFRRSLAARLPKNVEVIAENLADAHYPVVSAASIVAKVHRDAAIRRLRSQYGDFGWGYPGEKKTVTFLRRWVAAEGCLPRCARQKWLTCKRILRELTSDSPSQPA